MSNVTERDGTYDNRATNKREVWVNGIFAVNVPAVAFSHLRDSRGLPITVAPWSYFPDAPRNITPTVSA